jgi:hypothetical protein
MYQQPVIPGEPTSPVTDGVRYMEVHPSIVDGERETKTSYQYSQARSESTDRFWQRGTTPGQELMSELEGTEVPRPGDEIAELPGVRSPVEK